MDSHILKHFFYIQVPLDTTLATYLSRPTLKQPVTVVPKVIKQYIYILGIHLSHVIVDAMVGLCHVKIYAVLLNIQHIGVQLQVSYS